ncbi:type II restriction enzyme [Calothrix sp. PCC 6303]|uniref:type II restriction enzyme n=1 Tax=Calothrix sp. PCC 6303 TaxID=1170562 RepID=UPI0002A013E2|nr:hypothetical protein [Calothrix sp. PCC 6303]AFZ00363.1 hypothetical protein Cal6303_1303 [Calothrix sp. PCC 6303]
MSKGKNNIAWEKLFDKYAILEKISEFGYFEIESASINEFRESRLMAKFDHYASLPDIFKNYNLSILSISRSKYIIGRFDAYSKVAYNHDLQVTTVELPATIETIDDTNFYSESSALSCAFNTGMIHDLVNDGKMYHTVYGRMSTGEFEFSINSVLDELPSNIKVNKAQCEIDAGFESENYFLILEAKLYDVDDFIIRQLYYPYRLWSNKIPDKKIIPVLMTYSTSRNTFSFFIYKFDDLSNYNSIQLVEQRNYVIAPEIITHEDVDKIFKSIEIVSESDIPFPQANNFERVIDVLTLLVDKELTKDEITAEYRFDERQTEYYTDAARYLKLIDKYINPATGKLTFYLTDEGKHLLNGKYKKKIISLIKKILQHEAFYKTFKLTLENGLNPDIHTISEIIKSSSLSKNYADATIKRRSSTVRGWIDWILSIIS